MFTNVGGKIKTLAKVLCKIGVALGVIGGVVAICSAFILGAAMIPVGIAVIVFFPLASWLNSLFLYGFGELIEKTAEIAENTKKNNTEE